MKNASDIVLKILAIILLTPAVLKGWQLITEPLISYNLGRLADVKEWFVTTPAVALLTNSRITSAWEAKNPDFETILQKITKIQKNRRKFAFFINKSLNRVGIIERRCC